MFRAPGLPVGVPIRVRVDVPSLDGIVGTTATLSTHGQILDLGSLRLDQTPPSLVAIDPVDGTVGVARRPTIVVDASEALDPKSLRPEGILLAQGTNPAPVVVFATNGPAGPDSRIVVQPLEDLLSARPYTLLVLGADQVDATGRPVSRGPEDRAGRPLPRTVTSAFVVRDYEPPVVTAAFPFDGATEVEPESPVRFEFDEPVRTNLLAIVVRGPTGPIPGAPGWNANQRLVAWIPRRPLDANTTYQVELTGLVDLFDNAAPSRTHRFTTLDTAGPRIAVFRLAPGQRPVANATVTVEAHLERPEPDAVVRFRRNGIDLGIASEGPVFRWAVRLPAEGNVRLAAVALDVVGNPGEAALLELRVGPNDRPTVDLARVEPAFGPLETGRRFSFAATPSDDATVTRLRVVSSDGFAETREVHSPPNGVPTPFVFELPADFVAGGDLEFRVVALDDSGTSSDEVRLTYATRDATPPVLRLATAMDGATLDPRQPLRVTLGLRDNSTSVVARVALTGMVNVTNRYDLALSPNKETDLELDLPLSQGLEGGNVRLEVRLEDASGNGIVATRQYVLRGVVGPRFRFAQALDRGSSWRLPVQGPLSPWTASIMFYFDRALAIRPDDDRRLELALADGTPLPFTPRLSSSGVGLEIRGPALPAGADVRVRLRPGLADASGNPVLRADGSDFPDEGLEYSFRVARFGSLDVAPNRPVVPGQTLLVHLEHESEFPPWQLLLDDVPQPAHQLGSGGTRFRVHIPTNATGARLIARNAVADRPPIQLSPVELRLRSRADDDDGDGLPNGWEADRSWVGGTARFDPFDASDATKDDDADGLDHRSEFRRGTDPFVADTDGDGRRDGDESTPGSCPDPLVADSDGDGIRDGDDLAPCVAGEALVLEPRDIVVPEGTSQTNVVSVTAVGLTPLSIAFASSPPKPGFVEFADFAPSGTNPIRRALLLRPSFADAGEHRLVLAVQARRAFTVVGTNLELRIRVEDRPDTRFTRWARPSDGAWSRSTNWTAGLPGPGTNAVIDLPGTYTVTLDAPAFVESLILGSTNGSPTLNLGGHTLTVNGTATVGSNGVLRLGSQSRLTGQGGLRLDGIAFA
ncbi:MAG: Ig-like domain-containing protein, partial [Verrucomicrobiales bacterium]|nr:Ig-like domain-containing protein [Verrucomicrobiales bacterium]